MPSDTSMQARPAPPRRWNASSVGRASRIPLAAAVAAVRLAHRRSTGVVRARTGGSRLATRIRRRRKAGAAARTAQPETDRDADDRNTDEHDRWPRTRLRECDRTPLARLATRIAPRARAGIPTAFHHFGRRVAAVGRRTTRVPAHRRRTGTRIGSHVCRRGEQVVARRRRFGEDMRRRSLHRARNVVDVGVFAIQDLSRHGRSPSGFTAGRWQHVRVPLLTRRTRRSASDRRRRRSPQRGRRAVLRRMINRYRS